MEPKMGLAWGNVICKTRVHYAGRKGRRKWEGWEMGISYLYAPGWQIGLARRIGRLQCLSHQNGMKEVTAKTPRRLPEPR